MEPITALASLTSAFNELFYWFLVLFHQHYEIFLVILAIIAWFTIKRKKLFITALVLTILIAFAAKAVYDQPRPCVEESGFVPCPPGSGFPSSHAATATVFVLASIGTLSFYFFLPIGILVAWSRIYLGVHSVSQVAGGIALGAIIYLVLIEVAQRMFWEKKGKKLLKKIAKKMWEGV